MIDTHAHIDTNKFDEDRDEVITRALEAGVKSIIIPAISPNDFDNLERVANSYPNIFYGLGVHPHNANEYSDLVEQDILIRAKKEKVVAIGEIGIDYFYDFVPKEQQKIVFRKQIHIAKKLNLPIIVHNREADNDILEIIEDEQDGTLNGVLHCFSSSEEVMFKALELGFNVSFTGNITFKKSTLDEIVKLVPNDRFMIETDSPYITPTPFRGKRNEPAYVKFTAQKIAELKNISLEEVIKMTTDNAIKLFKLSIVILFLTISIGFAQETNDADDIIVIPNKKLIGIELIGGVNTIVEGQKTSKGQRDVSYEGIGVVGACLNYSPFNFLVVQAGFLQAKKKEKPERGDLINTTIDMIDFNSIWMANPQSKINFYLSTGFSLLTLTSDKLKEIPTSATDIKDGLEISKASSFNAGLGFIINIPVSGAGLFTLTAQWKLAFLLNDYNTYSANPNYKQPNDPLNPKWLKVPASAFYSIPNFGITFYPSF
ncbi:MAG: TatD family hydrolase [Candidatus Kapabacteria bacterium]|nr:TatD family hydrolase [Candidatus Kapabacteria bacterium]